MEFLQAGTEETARLLKRLDATLDKKVCQNLVYPKFRRQAAGLFRVRRGLQCPLFFRRAHSLAKIINPGRKSNYFSVGDAYRQVRMISSAVSSGVSASVGRVIWAAAS